ncbi:MAG: DegT/DnrJ/EryC1/StrS family aminotransferase [Thermomicrobiales bacterium]
MPKTQQKIYLSPPHMSGLEQSYVQDAFATNWIAPLGPHVDAFEREFCEITGAAHAVALTSGTAALHLAMIHLGVGPGDEVLGSTFTFSASVNPIAYCGARPTFIDSERTSWNMDPALLRETLAKRAQAGKLPKAVIVVDLYGQAADLDAIKAACDDYGVPLVEDAAAAVGTTYTGRHAGTVGKFGAFSFNGNKIITTSGGGMLVSDDGEAIAHARKLATQARDPAAHYLHTEIGYNYRLSNILAGVGRGQLVVIEDRVARRRANYDAYVRALGDLPGITFQPEAPWGRHTRWLINILIDPAAFGAGREVVRQALAAEEIESRPLWKPMHTQPVFAGCEHIGGAVAEELFATGLSLPSGSTLTEDDLARIVGVIRRCVR